MDRSPGEPWEGDSQQTKGLGFGLRDLVSGFILGIMEKKMKTTTLFWVLKFRVTSV